MEQFLNNLEQYLQNAPALALLAAFVSGVLTSFTPCVYPMIPVTIGIIGAKGAGSKLRGFALSLVYVVGMALTYSTLGFFAAATGTMFGKVSTNPIFYLVIANACIFFGLSMLGVFEISIPQSSFFASRFAGKGGFLTVLLFGIASGLIAAPCTAPVLGILLTFAATSGRPVYGFSLLFAFALGMGTLLLIVGTFTGLIASLPKSGIWLERVKKGIGFFLILVGEYFLIRMGQFIF